MPLVSFWKYQMKPNIPIMVLPGTGWPFEMLTRVIYFWHAEAPKKVLGSTFCSQSVKMDYPDWLKCPFYFPVLAQTQLSGEVSWQQKLAILHYSNMFSSLYTVAEYVLANGHKICYIKGDHAACWILCLNPGSGLVTRGWVELLFQPSYTSLLCYSVLASCPL